MKLAIAVLLIGILWKVSSAQELVIKRSSPDTIKIPASLCSPSNTAPQCAFIGGFKGVDKCTCQCNSINVFGFFDKTWKCKSKKDVRIHQECIDTHHRQEITHVQPALASKLIGEVFIEKASNCNLQQRFSYLGCHGNWIQMESASTGFRITTFKVIRNMSLYMNDKARFESYKPTIYGHVIKLTIECLSPKLHYHCILLELQGQLKCQVTPPTMAASRSSTFQQPLPTSSQRPPRSTSLSSQPAVFTFTRLNVTLVQGGGKKKTNIADNTGMIAGSVSGVVAMVALIFVVILVMKIKKQRCQNLRNRNRNTTTEDRTNSEHVEKIDDDNTEDNNVTNTTDQQARTDYYSYPYPNNLPHCGPISTGAAPQYEIADYHEPHVYGTLKGHVPHIYGSLADSPNIESGEVNLGYDDVIPSRDSQGIYEQLNQDGRQQSSDGEYQSLNPPYVDMSMNMTELNELSLNPYVDILPDESP